MWHHRWDSSIDHSAGTERQEGLLQSGKYSDFTIVCGDKSWKVHRCIICPQSKYFEVVADGCFLEGREKTITLGDDDPNSVQQMIDYLYKLDFDFYDDYKVKCKRPSFQLLDVYILADKYDIPGLRKWCRIAFKEGRYYETWTSASLHALVDAAWNSLPSNDKGLLKNIIKECARYICANVRSMDAGDKKPEHNDSARYLETIPVPESKEGPSTEQRDDSDGVYSETNPKPLSSVRWKHLLEDRDFTTRLRQAVIKEAEDFTYSHPNYHWLLQSRIGKRRNIELTLEDLQRYLEMDPDRIRGSK